MDPGYRMCTVACIIKHCFTATKYLQAEAQQDRLANKFAQQQDHLPISLIGAQTEATGSVEKSWFLQCCMLAQLPLDSNVTLAG